MADTDSIARLGAVAVTLIAATQRPTQKRPWAKARYGLRWTCGSVPGVREPRDVDLVLGQGMLRARWDAHNLNAPGKFLVSAPGHDKPKRAAPTCSQTRSLPKPPRVMRTADPAWTRNHSTPFAPRTTSATVQAEIRPEI
jgi:hypothetical protein